MAINLNVKGLHLTKCLRVLRDAAASAAAFTAVARSARGLLLEQLKALAGDASTLGVSRKLASSVSTLYFVFINVQLNLKA